MMTIERLKRKKTLPKMIGKQKMKWECDCKIHEHNRNDENMDKTKRKNNV